MKNGAIIIVLAALTGCASTQEVVNTIPTAVGTVATTAIFGGTVSMNPDPVQYIAEDINREGRVTYNDVRRKTQQAITDSIAILFRPAK